MNYHLSFLSLPKDALFPNPGISPFLFHDVLSCQGSHFPACSSCLWHLCPVTPNWFSFSLSTRDFLIYNTFSSASPPHHLPTQWPEMFPWTCPKTNLTASRFSAITFAFTCTLFSPGLGSTIGAASHLPTPLRFCLPKNNPHLRSLSKECLLVYRGVRWGL